MKSLSSRLVDVFDDRFKVTMFPLQVFPVFFGQLPKPKFLDIPWVAPQRCSLGRFGVVETHPKVAPEYLGPKEGAGLLGGLLLEVHRWRVQSYAHLIIIKGTRVREHSHWSRGCRNNNEEQGCSIMKHPPKTRTKTQINAALLAIKLASLTHCKLIFPRGSMKDRSVVGLEMDTHVAHFTPCQLTNPSTAPRKVETMWVLR